jgi:hypothetical protein
MRVLTLNEVARTAFPAISEYRKEGQTTSNYTCPYCKNTDTDVVRDPVILQPFETFYVTSTYKVLHCHCCEALFSVYTKKLN